MPNRLIHEASPYLRQHAENPVDWYPWGEEALARARQENKPIFLSVGYSACHWCHVMERESFEDPEIAEFLNRHFVCIKVDREEHPTLDSVYMDAVQIITGRGGWPMSVFLTPDLQPFYGGTYWPPRPRHGMPGFLQVVTRVAEAWEQRRDEAVAQGEKLTVLLRDLAQATVVAAQGPDEAVLQQGFHLLEQQFDPARGGFGNAPKFPHASAILFLLREWHRSGNRHALEMACRTLDGMADGGMYDHVGGGFHRYSTDAAWLIPHFEKMLYDNAQLARCYLEGWQATRHERYRQVVVDTLEYMLRDMRSPEDAFYAAEDADSEGAEGKFYVWTPEEIDAALEADDAAVARCVFGVTEAGNFEGSNVLFRPRSLRACAEELGMSIDELETALGRIVERLRTVRAQRVRPARDTKILLGWNALAVDALARAGAVLGRLDFTLAAVSAFRFLDTAMRDASGRLLIRHCEGEARHIAPMRDCALFAAAAVTMYEVSGDETYLSKAIDTTEDVEKRFSHESGAYFMSDAADGALPVRKLDLLDDAVPSGTGVMAETLLRLAELTGNESYHERAERAVRSLLGWVRQAPLGSGQALTAAQRFVAGELSAVFVLPENFPSDDPNSPLPAKWRQPYLPHCVVALRREKAARGDSPTASIFEGRTARQGQVTLYLCHNHRCEEPAVGESAVETALNAHVRPIE
ncbi:thioredoxin domain-containing protein [Thermostilla marina]